MALADARTGSGEPPKVSLLYNPALRSTVYQVVTIIVIVSAVWYAWNNVVQNLARANMSAGFGFLNSRAGFDVAQSLIAYSSDSTYFRALQVGLINTLVVAAAGIVTATIVGLLVGIGRLSHNWLIARLCTVYVEIFRNIPPLLVIFFWYLGVLALLPSIRTIFQHVKDNPGASFFISNRGIYMPAPVFGEGFGMVLAAFLIGVVAAIGFTIWANARQQATGLRPPVLWVNLGLIVLFPLIVFVAMGSPLSLDYAVPGSFNMNGGHGHRAGIPGALPGAVLLYGVLYRRDRARRHSRRQQGADGSRLCARAAPRPDRHASSCAAGAAHHHSAADQPVSQPDQELVARAIAIGYPDLVAVGGTILNQTGQVDRIISIWMVIYLGHQPD
jgi:general L-amino acid transport system permease protein